MKVLGLAGWSGAGKTTLLTRLLPVFAARGLSVSTIKHAHHGFDVDQPGKDSFLHREAGAREVLVASDRRWALMHENRVHSEPVLGDLLTRLSPCDLVLVEGFRSGAHRKLEVFRSANGKPFLFAGDGNIVAVAGDAPPSGCTLPFAHLDAVDAVAELVLGSAEPTERLMARSAERNRSS